MDKKINNIKEFIFLIQLDWLTNTHTHINTFHHCVNYHNRTKKKIKCQTWQKCLWNMMWDSGTRLTVLSEHEWGPKCWWRQLHTYWNATSSRWVFFQCVFNEFFWWEEAPGRRKRNADNYSAVHLHSAPSSAHRRDAGVVCICVCVWETHTHRYTLCVLQCTAWYHLSVLLH